MIDMSKYTQVAQVADNEVVINGVSFGKVTNTDAERIISIIRGMQDMSTPTQVSKPERKREELAPAEDVVLKITPVAVGKGKVAFTLGYGAGREGAKAYIKSVGFAWDGTIDCGNGKHNAYVGTTAQAKELGLTSKSTTLNVPAQWVQAGRDKAQAKAAKRA